MAWVPQRSHSSGINLSCPVTEKSSGLGKNCVSVVSSIQVNDLSIERSEVELKEDNAIHIAVKNMTALFKGTLTYGYAGAWL